ncbi:hypothetical protein WN51_12738 [Melipona quadrifasciata]|uniref:Uncharacterized protein n=1 Tax=Melipona quadrifasciata TaxID=166423 RepID=A0A0M9A399_9HYME|nr:hypothetical protein WN51_12738 [Melipona quadrifasciata]
MKKRGNHETKAGKGRQNETSNANDKRNEEKDDARLNDVENQGFSEWLRSSDGLEMMRLFVIANSILVFVTIGFPKIQEAFGALKDYYLGETE